jgi:DNA-binding NtrC family response regulator
MPMKQILVVGSDPKVSQDLDEYLDRGEYKLLACPQGKSVLTSLLNAKPDLVIFDANPLDVSTPELIKKIKRLNSVLPLIVLSDDRFRQVKELESEGQIYGWLTPPVQMEKLAFMVREALSSKPSKQEKKVLLGSVRLSSQDKKSEEAGKDKEKSLLHAPSDSPGYHQLFTQLLSPIFDQIIRDWEGQIYDRLLSDLEKTMISAVLKAVNHNQVKAAQVLGISRNTLRERMKKFDIF